MLKFSFNARKRTKVVKGSEIYTKAGAQIHMKLSKVHCYHYHVDMPHFRHLLEILPDVSHRILLF